MDYYYSREMSSFLLEMLLAVVIFIYDKKRRKTFVPRLLVSLAVIYFTTMASTKFVNHFLYDQFIWRQIIKYLVPYSLFVAANYFCFDISFKKAIFIAGEGYAVQNYSYLIMSIFSRYYQGSFDNWNYIRLAGHIALGVATFLAVFKTKKYDGDSYESNAQLMLSLGLILVVIVLNSFAARSMKDVVFKIYAILLDIVMLLLHLGILRVYDREKQIKQYSEMLNLQRKQQEISKNAVDIINYKCHDLRHQLMAIKNIKSDVDRKELIAEVESRITDYEISAETGNAALDIVVTEKYLLCLKENIEFSYMIDGEKLSFMDNLDICALFGNALENAIESVKKVDEEKRFVSLSVTAKNNLINIHMENYCDRAPEFRDGIPVTTKDNAAFHGYGTRSINRVVKKYAGNTVMKFDANLFITDIIIPVS